MMGEFLRLSLLHFVYPWAFDLRPLAQEKHVAKPCAKPMGVLILSLSIPNKRCEENSAHFGMMF